MSDVVIQVENLGKRYKIGKRERYKALRDTLADAMGAPLRMARAALRRDAELAKDASDDQFWALKDISFEVKRGEVVGVIGRNGAGKSTLLKILSRITRPTEGRVTMRGRVGSLLEVGTGFHPELTGRENISLNGAILGMKRVDIIRKFDEIVAFAEVEQFIDTPVKHYSSGMYMRLAFAVAAHLEPEILVVDEVLAVGDAQFQKKCLGKMGDVAKEGRTVLFVSHNMGAVESLCSRGILLVDGKCNGDGSIRHIVSKYANYIQFKGTSPITVVEERHRLKSSTSAKIQKITITDNMDENRRDFAVWETLKFILNIEVMTEKTSISAWILLSDHHDRIISSMFQFDNMQPLELNRGEYTFSTQLTPNILIPGEYYISAGIFGRYNDFYDWVHNVSGFTIESRTNSGGYFDSRLGLTTLVTDWEVFQCE